MVHARCKNVRARALLNISGRVEYIRIVDVFFCLCYPQPPVLIHHASMQAVLHLYKSPRVCVCPHTFNQTCEHVCVCVRVCVCIKPNRKGAINQIDIYISIGCGFVRSTARPFGLAVVPVCYFTPLDLIWIMSC